MTVFSRILLLTTPVVLILAGIIGFVIIRRLLKPLDTMIHVAQNIEGVSVPQKITVVTQDELGGFAEVLNQTFERVYRVFTRQRDALADVSHDLKTPVAIIKGEATAALRQEGRLEDYAHALDAIDKETDRLSEIISQLMLASRLENRNSLVLNDIDLRAFLTDVAEDAAVLCEAKSLNFDFNCPDNPIINSDKAKLRIMLLNIIDNAVKYTPVGGSVWLSMSKQDGWVSIAVRDTGEGIAREHLPFIFERLYRAGKPIDDTGIGIGLAICKAIAVAHGGRIEVESKIGRGSKFTVLLPLNDRQS